MTAKKQTVGAVKATGVNKGIKHGVEAEQFEGRVICKKCGKDIEFTLGSELFLKCPRCRNKVERDLKSENKESKKIIKFDLLRRSKKYLLHFGVLLTALALTYNIFGFFSSLFANHGWWLALVSLPLVALSVACTRITRLKSASKKYRFFAWLAIGLNLAALAVICITALPELNARLLTLYASF